MRSAWETKAAEEKTEYYRRELAKREKVAFRSKRDFSELTLTVGEVEQVGSEVQEQDVYETFEDWSFRQMMLGKCKDQTECHALWAKMAEDRRCPSCTRGASG